MIKLPRKHYADNIDWLLQTFVLIKILDKNIYAKRDLPGLTMTLAALKRLASSI